jgi:2-polyprenyl-3-methyl-5-hydroxy-6-metoxy-1,4-benzoquinol methylase
LTQPTSSADPQRFAFGQNWRRFLDTVDEQRIADAQSSLQALLHRADLDQQRFLDAGCGSGLFSLAAVRMGALVTSFDADDDSVACAHELKRRYCDAAAPWTIETGTLLDAQFLRSLGEFDVVYCWGVVHHTGRMWEAIDNLLPCVAEEGVLVLSIYNDQLYVSRAWAGVKQIYQRLPRLLRPLLVAAVGAALFVKRLLMTLVASAARVLLLRNPLVPFANWMREAQARGMHGWYDLTDWVGGWPFEVARPETVFRYLRDRGVQLQELTTSTGHGCNEFLFVRQPQGADAASAASSTAHETPVAARPLAP